LFHLIHSLDLAIESDFESKMAQLISFLESYVRDHFKEEEDLMVSKSFKGYEHHKQEHEEFVSQVQVLRKLFEESNAKAHLIFRMRQFIDQLVLHVQTVDSEIRDIV